MSRVTFFIISLYSFSPNKKKELLARTQKLYLEDITVSAWRHLRQNAGLTFYSESNSSGVVMVIGKQERQQEQRVVRGLRVCWVKNEDFFFFQFFLPLFFSSNRRILFLSWIEKSSECPDSMR